MFGARSLGLGSLLTMITLGGCAGGPAQEERSARTEMRATGAMLLARDGRPALPELRPESPPEEFVAVRY